MKDGANYAVFSYIAYVIVYCVAYTLVGSYDIGNVAVSCVDPIAQHQNERMLSVVYDLSVLVGLISIWFFRIRTILGGVLVGVIMGIGAGGVFVFGAVEDWLPVMLAVAVSIATIAFVLLHRPFFCAYIAVSLVFVSAQVAFFFVV